MNRWPMKSLLSSCRLIGDRVEAFTGTRQYISTGDVNGIEIVTSQLVNFDDRPARADLVAEKGDVLMARMQGTEKVIVVTDDTQNYIWSTGFAAFRPRQGTNSKWLYYWLRSRAFQEMKDGLCTGSTQKAITNEGIAELTIPLPSPKDQDRIVQLMDEAEAIGSLRNQANSKANALRKNLFLQYFGDPVTNPHNWTSSTVGNHLSLIEYGPRFYNESYTTDGIRIVRITDLDSTGQLNFNSMPRQPADATTVKARTLKPGDLIFARSGATVGKVALIPDGAPPCIAGAYFIRMRFDGVVDPVFAFEFFRCDSIQNIIGRQSKQAAQPNFSGPLIKSLPLPIPPMKLQIEFAARAIEIGTLISLQSSSRNRLNNLLPALLHRAVQGKL
jgi:type I restriction enzyme S subunit